MNKAVKILSVVATIAATAAIVFVVHASSVPHGPAFQASIQISEPPAPVTESVFVETTRAENLTNTPATLSHAISPPVTAPAAAAPSATQPPAPSTPAPTTPAAVNGSWPVRLIVPVIGLDVPIEYMGINEKGEMAVPDGKTRNVGWYKDGTVPGNTGSAVFAAHVYAAFSKLKDVPLGSDIYVVRSDGTKLLFRAGEAKTHWLNQMSAEDLFNRNDAKRLNLITCAGTYIKELDTYDRRLVIYATLVE